MPRWAVLIPPDAIGHGARREWSWGGGAAMWVLMLVLGLVVLAAMIGLIAACERL